MNFKRGLHMRTSFIGLSALALAAATPALAADAAPFTISGSAALTTDYRFRGISQSDKRIAAQASATVTHSSGVYASFWASSIDETTVYPGASTELDLIAGYSKTISGVTLDGGVLYYVYANTISGFPSDFFEPYASVKSTFGPLTAKLGVAYAPKQHAVARPSTYGTGGRDDNLYVYTDLSAAIPKTPITLSGHLGYSKGPSFLTLGVPHYYDWNIGASYTYKIATFAVSYVDTSANSGQFVGGVNGRDQGKAGVVGSVTFAF